jgi:hypothetical protein
MSMLYFLNMNFRQPTTPEPIEGRSGFPPAVSVLLEELSPFGVFLSQCLYMTGWLFPGNTLPDSWKAVASSLESSIKLNSVPGEPEDHD